MNLEKISKCFFINLNRRKDRLDHINKTLPFYAQRFRAIDANELELSPQIQKLFKNCINKLTKAEIACALSHYSLWKRLVADKDADNYLILEDDVVFKPGFQSFWNSVFSQNLPDKYNLIYLGGCQPWNKPQYHKVLKPHNQYFCNIKKNDFFTKNDHYFHMNTQSYIISKQGASLICQYIEQYGFNLEKPQALDIFMINFFNRNKLFEMPHTIFHLHPLMSHQLHEENDNAEPDKNSDLRFSKEKFKIEGSNLIPKNIFQTWEENKLNIVFEYSTTKVKQKNSNYKYYFSNKNDRRDFIKKNFDPIVLGVYDKIIPGAFKADLWRYCVLYKLGGIYADIDMICLDSFDKVIKDVDFFAPIDLNPNTSKTSHNVCNAFIGCKPGHPIIKNCIDLLVENVNEERWLKEKMEPLDFSGPGLLGRAINLFLGKPELESLKRKESIIIHNNFKIKLMHFEKNTEYMKDLDGSKIFQNKNGNPEFKKLIHKLERKEDIKPWILYLSKGQLPYIPNEKISLINPTAITHDNKQYTLYRGEKYLKGKPPPLGFNRSELSYWLERDGFKKQCIFDFGEYSYKTIRRMDIEKKSNNSIIEDLRFIESSTKETKNGLICLATCTLLPHVTIFDGTKNKYGKFDKSKPISIAYTFKMAYCEVNLTNGIIKYKGIINPESQIKNEKNWTSFIHNNNFFVIYSISPLVYSKASSLEEIKFKKTNLPDKLDFYCSTNPINIGGDKFAMFCHIRNQSKDFCYDYKLVTFNIFNGEIININKSDINVGSKLYCSSIILDGNKIKVLAGKEDLGNSSFYINIPASPVFPNISSIIHKEIPKKIHLSWKDKNVLSSNYQLIKKGAKNLEILNPDWNIQVYDDEDINQTLRDSIGLQNWNLIKDRKITEKTDLWRLIKTYKEGGLYIDIDRYIDTPLSEIINEKTSMVLPTFQNVDFSQDFILTCAQNPVIGKAIEKNINYRKNGKSLFFLAVQSYMHAVTEILDGKPTNRGTNEKYFNAFRAKLNKVDFIETYQETGPGNHILFRNLSNSFDELTFKKDKADFYNQENVIHWNTETEKLHKSFRKQPKNIIWQSMGGINNCYERDWIMEIFSGIEVNHIEDEDMEFATENSIVIYSDMFSHDINRYPKSIHKKWKHIQSQQQKYFDKFKNFKNCILFHLSDEHTQANTSHYKYFKHVFRNYYRKDVDQENVTFIPLGYGRGFNDLTNKTS